MTLLKDSPGDPGAVGGQDCRLSEMGHDRKGMCFLPDSELSSYLSHQVPSKDAGPMGKGEQGTRGWRVDKRRHSRESNFQAMVMPPISESLKRNKKVPSGLLMSRSWACCLFTKPRMALGARNIQCHRWASSHCPLSPCPPNPPARHASPVIPMGLVMLLQHLHDPVKPLPEGIVPARQVLLRTPRNPKSALGPCRHRWPRKPPCPHPDPLPIPRPTCPTLRLSINGHSPQPLC